MNTVPVVPEVLFQIRWRRRMRGELADPGSPGETVVK